MKTPLLHLDARCFFLPRSGTSRTIGTVTRASQAEKVLGAKSIRKEQALLGLSEAVQEWA